MWLSDISIKRPVFASVLGLLLVALGIASFSRLALREYPDIDPPIVSISTSYAGASANVVEARITEVLEDQIAGLEGMRYVSSTSQDGQSRISIEFDISRDLDAAANDVRDRVARASRQLPIEADPPQVEKADADAEVIMWINLSHDSLPPLELTDYAERYLIDRFAAIDGVARVQVGGQQSYAMRVWLDRRAIAARGLTVGDIERALRSENVESPAGSLTSEDLDFTVRIDRPFRTPEDFAGLVIVSAAEGNLVRLGDLARVELASVEDRSIFRGNGQPMIGLGIVKQSTANVVEVAASARALITELNETMPDGLRLDVNFDGSIFVDASIREVFITLGIAVVLVVLVIYLFLGSWRATIIPAVTVPISLIATFTVLFALGLSINLLTLLALVLAIGIVVDDSIVVLENTHRRIEEQHETPLVAAYRGARQVGFAVVATTMVLIAVFVPITFMEGAVGRLFTEFAITIAAAVGFSMIVALSLSPMMSSKLLRPHGVGAKPGGFSERIDRMFAILRAGYGRVFDATVKRPIAIAAAFLAVVAGSFLLLRAVPAEFVPDEDRGSFFMQIVGPEGASFEYMLPYLEEVERRLTPYLESGELERVSIRAPSFGGGFNSGAVIVLMADWGQRRDGFTIINEINRSLADLPGVRAFGAMRSSLGGGRGPGGGKPIQFVIGGPSYETLVEWRDTFLTAIAEDNPGISNIDWDYKETQQQYRVKVDYDRAADMGVTVQEIGATLQTMQGSRRVGTFVRDGEEYDLILEGERADQSTPTDVMSQFVRSQRSRELIPLSNLISVEPTADSRRLNRYNRVRAITIDATLEPGVSIGVALDRMEQIARRVLPDQAVIDYKGASLEYKRSSSSMGFVFAFGVIVVFLVLAAQFESWIHPIVIMLCVPATVGGGLLSLWLTGNTINIYSQIGLIMLVGLAAKNGILIVEFANQLRDQGRSFDAALREAALTRFRPILMTSLTALAGALPLIFAHGAGSETRSVIGIVIFAGVVSAAIVTLIIVPAAYALLARGTGSPLATERRLEEEAASQPPMAPAE
ncbi:MMPL family transporter [bacterium]|nr:MMPL family transporter [bacterium]